MFFRLQKFSVAKFYSSLIQVIQVYVRSIPFQIFPRIFLVLLRNKIRKKRYHWDAQRSLSSLRSWKTIVKNEHLEYNYNSYQKTIDVLFQSCIKVMFTYFWPVVYWNKLQTYLERTHLYAFRATVSGIIQLLIHVQIVIYWKFRRIPEAKLFERKTTL